MTSRNRSATGRGKYDEQQAIAKTNTLSFITKGQVVIPRWLRKDFEINEGTRAVVYKHNDHIVLKPLTAQHYRRLRGSLKGTKAMDVFMSERKREREL